MSKINLSNLSDACECPFYVSIGNDMGCMIKKVTTPDQIAAQVMEPVGVPEEIWNADCEGKFENCSVLPLLYYVDEEDESSPSDEPESPSENENDSDVANSSEEPSKPKITVHKVDNFYRVNCDVVAVPINSLLEVTDALLDEMSQSEIQVELSEIRRKMSEQGMKVDMGHVYPTEGSKHVAAKCVHHLVVSGPSLLPNAAHIQTATLRSLMLAEAQKATNVVIVPADMGNLDLYNAAIAQVKAVHRFVASGDAKHVKNIYFVMSDDESISVYKEYMQRVLKNAN